ncbi:hypothetical protein [uncultured Bacteroides sp.]|uniref:hypothetical protein n=1 Tax=uncultured Bacteroides sp. TaxID=162156 RepID=UPI0025EAC27B|nr:hypothetical protein [uncultured Bacteroides sp.]
MDMDTFLMMLHVVLCLTVLPLFMKGMDRLFVVIAVVISLWATPAAMVIGPAAAFVGYGCIWLLGKIFGLPIR